MQKSHIYVAAAAVSVTFIIEEIRAYRFMKECERRMQESSILLAALEERIEMLEV